MKVLSGHGGAVERSAFSPDGTRLVTELQGSLRLWDVATGKLTASLPSGRSGLVSLFLTDSQIAAGYIDGTLLTWTQSRSLMVESLPPSSRRMLAATADGRRLMDLDGHTFKLLDGVNEVSRFTGGAGTVIHAAFAPDGKRILGLYDDSLFASGTRLRRDRFRSCAVSQTRPGRPFRRTGSKCSVSARATATPFFGTPPSCTDWCSQWPRGCCAPRGFQSRRKPDRYIFE